MKKFLLALGLCIMTAGAANAACPTACTITSSSTTILTLKQNTKRLSIDNESATATVACNFGGTAVLNTAGNYTILPGQTRVWQMLPNAGTLYGPLNCISSAATSPATIEQH